MCVESPPAARTSAYDACSRAFKLCTHMHTYPLHPSSTCPTRSFARAALHPASCSRPRQRQLGTAARRHSAKAWALGVAVAAVASRTYFSRAVGMAPAHEPRRGRTRPLSDESLPFERGGVIRHSARVNTAPPPVACQIALGLLAFHFSGSFGTGTLVPTHVLAVEDRSIGAHGGGHSYLHILYPKILGTPYLISLLLPPLRGRCGARVPGTFLWVRSSGNVPRHSARAARENV